MSFLSKLTYTLLIAVAACGCSVPLQTESGPDPLGGASVGTGEDGVERSEALLAWIGNTYSWPGTPSCADDLWVNTETWPAGSATSVGIAYSVDGGVWKNAPMSWSGPSGNNDAWHINLGNFPCGTIVKYAVTAVSGGVQLWDNNNFNDYTAVTAACGKLGWVGKTDHWPVDGNFSADDLWVNTYTWPACSARRAIVRYTTNNWGSYSDVEMETVGQVGNNESWHIKLPGLKCGTTVKYAVEAMDKNGAWHWDNNGGANYSKQLGPCSKILLQDDFNDGVLSPAWSYWRMQFAETGGRLNVVSAVRPGFNYGHSGNGRSAKVITHIGDQTWKDYHVELDTEALAVGALNPHGVPSCHRSVAVILRVQEDSESWNAPAQTYYYLMYETKDCPGWSTRGYWRFGRSHNNWLNGMGCCSGQQGSVKEILTGNSAAIVDGPNHVAIDVKGDRFKFWVNGTQVFDHQDTAGYDPGQQPITYGGVGVTWGWEDTGWLDNMVITSL